MSDDFKKKDPELPHPPHHKPPHHDIPPHILKEIMELKAKVGRLEGIVEMLMKAK